MEQNQPNNLKKYWWAYSLAFLFMVVTVVVAFILPFDEKQPLSAVKYDDGVFMNFVSGTEYRPGQNGQVIVEARYALNGSTAIKSVVCYQGAFNASSSCGGVASSAQDYLEGQTISFGQTNITFNNSQDNQNRHTDAIFNYTKPAGARNNSFFVAGVSNGTDIETFNITIPSSCWNAYSTKIQFGVRLGNFQTVSPFYTQFVQIFCYNSSSYQSIYLAGSTIGSGSDNPNGVVSNLRYSFDNDFLTLTCSALAFGELQYSPSPPFFGNQACRRGGSQQFTSGSSVAEFGMYWDISNCIASIWYPDKSAFLINQTMNLSDSNGNAFINFVVPNIDGVFEYQSTCTVGSRSLVASKSFHVTVPRIKAVVVK